MEQLDYNLLYRCSWGLRPTILWDPTTFTKNRDRLQNGEVFTKLMSKLLNHSAGQTTVVGRAFFGGRSSSRPGLRRRSLRLKDGSATKTVPTFMDRSVRTRR